MQRQAERQAEQPKAERVHLAPGAETVLLAAVVKQARRDLYSRWTSPKVKSDAYNLFVAIDEARNGR